jgi:hypothetical protein
MKKMMTLLLLMPMLQGCNQQAPTGRFQIVAGTYDEIVNSGGANSTSQMHGIFKIDTQTGNAWVYIDANAIIANGVSSTEGWREIKNMTTTIH